MDQGEGDDAPSLKEAPQDFALWKAHKEGEDTWWDAPWGEGGPGWHIECSAMAEAILGLDFEIHGGGSDLVFPHHENEIAQTEAAREQPLARIWMHNGMVEMGDEKMAKSVGNIRLLHEALDEVGRDAWSCTSSVGHYRQAAGVLAGGARGRRAAVERVRDFAAASTGTRRPAEPSRPPSASSTPWPTTSTRRRPARALFDWVAEANRRLDAARASDSAGPAPRDAPRARPRAAARGGGGGRPRSRAPGASARGRARRATSSAPTGSRRARRARAGRSATPRTARSSCARRSDRLRPQPRARGAARAPRPRVGHGATAAREEVGGWRRAVIAEAVGS